MKRMLQGEKVMRKGLAIVCALAVLTIGGTASAEGSGVRIEARGGIGLPTFDIADVAKIGGLGGVGVWYTPTDSKWTFGAEADFGIHPGEDLEVGSATVEGPDVNVYHLMGKAGYNLYSSDDGKLDVIANLGAGAVMFDVDVEGADMETYLAINAGGKIYYALSSQIDFVVSLQGDIAFTDKDVLGTDNAWVWPLGVGIAIKL
ncbi:outer membrane beta-barrel protein [candidate division GN15 bacterium]|nr:outer membrane beta-barrel protein [candidate division GN15 bacterium]